jgi:large repetitive protein
MLPQSARFDRLGWVKLLTVLTPLSVIWLALACDKVPLLAPTGSVITLFPVATMVPANGHVEIVATVIEQGVASAAPTTTTPGTPTTPTTPTATSSAGAGTPVQNGTLVSFTTTIGHLDPREARTQNGEVRTQFYPDGQSGTATITAYSGGASGKLENLKVGTAAAERVLISATPQALSCSGGTTEVAARVEDVAGTGLAGVPVTFTTTTGQLNPAATTTDSAGVARTLLTTTREATVTANAAGKTAPVTVTLSPRTGLSLAAPTTAVSAGVPTTFTVNVSSTANISSVVLDFGDGSSQPLGSISGSTPVSHTYLQAGTYVVSATAADAGGCSERVATAVTILPGQPPSVIITASNNNPSVGEVVVLTATVSGNTSTILRYEWNFGSGAVPPTASTTGNRATVSWATTGTKIITVTVFQATGPQGDGQTAVVVKP